MGAFNDVTEKTLRALADMQADGDTVLSIYMDLDPSRFATAPARASEISSLMDEAHREIERAERGHDELQALRAALEHAREILESDSSLPKGARAVALFVCEPLELARAVRLPHPVGSTVVISNAPFIAPLAEAGPAGRVCVALVDERHARILRGSGERLREASSFGDPVHGRHDQGGWSQARYQRSVNKDVEDHLRHVARVLHDLLRIAPYDLLLIACTEPLWPRITAKLHADVRARLRDERLSLDIGDVGIADVEAAAESTLAAERTAHEDALLAELRERHAHDGAADGLQPVLQALVERRVQTLLYDAGLHADGVLCTNCGWMGTDGESCPVDGEPLQQSEDIVEQAVESAVGQSAEILALTDRPELGPYGKIAALLRF